MLCCFVRESMFREVPHIVERVYLFIYFLLDASLIMTLSNSGMAVA